MIFPKLAKTGLLSLLRPLHTPELTRRTHDRIRARTLQPEDQYKCLGKKIKLELEFQKTIPVSLLNSFSTSFVNGNVKKLLCQVFVSEEIEGKLKRHNCDILIFSCPPGGNRTPINALEERCSIR